MQKSMRWTKENCVFEILEAIFNFFFAGYRLLPLYNNAQFPEQTQTKLERENRD